jgi:hypothetical protein
VRKLTLMTFESIIRTFDSANMVFVAAVAKKFDLCIDKKFDLFIDKKFDPSSP